MGSFLDNFDTFTNPTQDYNNKLHNNVVHS